MFMKILTSSLLLSSSYLFATDVTTQKTSPKPKLILQITVDQLRGDLPDKFMKNMGDGGFRLKWNKQPSLKRLKKKFGVGQDLIEAFFPPYIYLNHSVIKEKGLDLAEVQKAVAKEIMDIDGIALTVTSAEMKNNTLPDTYLYNAALKNFNAKRSGDILILFEPQCFANDTDGGAIMASNHGGPWRYDTFVPIIFAGNGLKGKQLYRAVKPNDITPTLSAIVNAKSPSGANGDILEEVLEGVRQQIVFSYEIDYTVIDLLWFST